MDRALLGTFNRTVGYQYQQILEEAGIEVLVVDTVNQYEKNRASVNIQLFVFLEDQLKAERLIRDFEFKSTERVKELAASLDWKMLLVFLMFVGGFLVLIIFTSQR